MFPAHAALDEVLGNATDLPITEHATDTHGATLANFALFDLCGKQLSPRIRDLAHITLCRPGPRAEYAARYPHAGPLLTRRLQSELITGCWDDLLRVAASVHGGHAAAALVVGKLCSSKKQQNTLTAAMKEYGTLRRTIFAARYLADEAYQRRIGRQLNKGENIHTLKRNIAHARQGTLRRRHPEQQTEQMWCLTLVTNAVVCWMTEYLGLAVAALRATGRQVDDEILAHIWPTHHENVLLYGTHTVDIEADLAGLDANGYRPLRTPGSQHQPPPYPPGDRLRWRSSAGTAAVRGPSRAGRPPARRLHPVAQLQLGQHPGHVGFQVPHSPRRLDETGFMDADGHLDPVRGVQLDQDV